MRLTRCRLRQGGTWCSNDCNSQFITHVQVARPSLDLFKAIFAESSDESVVSSDESDVESVATSSHKTSNDTTKSESTNQSGSRWQDLSTVASHSVNAEVVSSLPPTLNQSYDDRKTSDSAENSRPPDQPAECYGPSLPPSKHSMYWNSGYSNYWHFVIGIDQQEYTREPSPERRHRHHHTKRSHKKKDRKLVSLRNAECNILRCFILRISNSHSCTQLRNIKRWNTNIQSIRDRRFDCVHFILISCILCNYYCYYLSHKANQCSKDISPYNQPAQMFSDHYGN